MNLSEIPSMILKLCLIMVLALIIYIAAIASFGCQPATSQSPSVTLTWTSPGDDGNTGTAASYEMRYSTVAPDTSSSTTFGNWWNAATTVANLPTPLIAGTSQSMTIVANFLTETKYYFVIRSIDNAGNISAFSNVAWRLQPDFIPPSRISDLR